MWKPDTAHGKRLEAQALRAEARRLVNRAQLLDAAADEQDEQDKEA